MKLCLVNIVLMLLIMSKREIVDGKEIETNLMRRDKAAEGEISTRAYCKPCPTPSKYRGICASDGNNYGNRCEMEYAACQSGKKITRRCSAPCPCCFHDQSKVMTPAGPKNLRDVSVGEEVLTVSDSGLLRFEPVIVDLHRDAHAHTWFYKIQTQTHEIMVTPKHYVYVGETVESSHLVMSDDVRVGDSLLVNINSSVGTEKVTNIEMIYDRGISNPLVSSGRILVNNILASVYVGDFPPLKPKDMHSILWCIRMLSSMKIDTVDVIEESSGKPYWAAYSELLLRKIV